MDEIIQYEQPAVVDVYMPAATVKQAMERREIIKNFVSLAMKRDHDYGIIPGTQKPTLLKPGAEKLCNLFGLSPAFTVSKEIEDWTGENHGGEMFFHYGYKCILTRNGIVVGEGEGSVNSWEKKYRYRTLNKNTPEEQKIPNPEIADQVNTLQKMAQKRALIAAVLIACSASEFFTQDMEDDSGCASERPTHKRTPPGNPDAISDGQRKRLYAIYKQSGKSEAQMKDILSLHGFEQSADVTRGEYEQICTEVQAS